MEYIKRLKLSFLGVVFLIFIPLIIFISSSMAIVNYKQSYDLIIDVIDNKLVSIASVTSSFIDGDEYKKVLEAKQMKAYGYDRINDTLYSVGVDNKIYTIDQKLGAARVVKDMDTSFYEIMDISIISENLYILTKDNLVQINLKDKKSKEIKKFDKLFDSISLRNLDEIYLSSGNKLYSLKSDKLELLKEFEYEISSLNYSKDSLYLINKDEQKISNVSLNDFEIKNIEFEEFPSETTDIKAFAVAGNRIYMGDKHLVIYDLLKKELDHENFARMFRDEGLEEYKKYHDPMTEIKLALNLTYHYTLNLLYGDDENNCFYIFDVHAGNEYSPIGSYDFMDIDDLKGAEDVVYRDLAYVGDVKLWEKWGLLKVAYTGIKDSDDNVVGVTGTDVDISFIKSKTHEALVHSITIGLITLVFSIVASYYIALKILGPIEKLKSSALKIAAGKYDEKVIIDSPSELSDLSDAFNHMSEQLTLEIRNFKNYTLEIKERKENEKLQKKLHYLNDFKDSKVQVNTTKADAKPYGITLYDHTYYAWSAKAKQEQKVEVIKNSAVINDMLMRILESHENIDAFKDINDLESFVKIDINSHSIIDLMSGEKIDYNSETKSEIKVGDIEISISPAHN
jgi:HAMP domain-containing protein